MWEYALLSLTAHFVQKYQKLIDIVKKHVDVCFIACNIAFLQKGAGITLKEEG